MFNYCITLLYFILYCNQRTLSDSYAV